MIRSFLQHTRNFTTTSRNHFEKQMDAVIENNLEKLKQSYNTCNHIYPGVIQLSSALNFKNGIKYCLDNNTDVNEYYNDDKMRTTPLFMAVYTNNYNISKFLISNGANPNLNCNVYPFDKHNNNVYPLHFATMHENVKLIKLLANNNAIIDCMNEAQETPLLHAIGGYKFLSEKELLNYGAEPLLLI